MRHLGKGAEPHGDKPSLRQQCQQHSAYHGGKDHGYGLRGGVEDVKEGGAGGRGRGGGIHGKRERRRHSYNVGTVFVFVGRCRCKVEAKRLQGKSGDRDSEAKPRHDVIPLGH